MSTQQQTKTTMRASQRPAPAGTIAAANNFLPFAFTCLVCLSILVSLLIILPR